MYLSEYTLSTEAPFGGVLTVFLTSFLSTGTFPNVTPVFIHSAGEGTHLIHETGVIGPGVYDLRTEAGIQGTVHSHLAYGLRGFASFNSTFVANPVPEPATMMLLATGLVCLAARRLRSRSYSSASAGGAGFPRRDPSAG